MRGINSYVALICPEINSPVGLSVNWYRGIRPFSTTPPPKKKKIHHIYSYAHFHGYIFYFHFVLNLIFKYKKYVHQTKILAGRHDPKILFPYGSELMFLRYRKITRQTKYHKLNELSGKI